MQKWEYWVASLDTLDDSTVIEWLNEAGQDGWELVSMTPNLIMDIHNPSAGVGRVVVLALKRPHLK